MKRIKTITRHLVELVVPSFEDTLAKPSIKARRFKREMGRLTPIDPSAAMYFGARYA